MNADSLIVTKAEKFVFDFFKNSDTSKLYYHNYNHTNNVFEACKTIASASEIDKKNLEIILLAALFHDVGYLKSYKNHEDFSIIAAEKFLTIAKYNIENTQQVIACINATKIHVKPSNLLEEIICDADLIGLGKNNFYTNSRLLKEEKFALLNINLTQQEWLVQEISFFSTHQYYTKYAQLHYTQQKNINILTFKKELAIVQKKNAKENEKTKIVNKKNNPERAIDTMFRTTMRNHISLSAIADKKANIMLSINAIFLSITLSQLVPKFNKHEELIIPTIFILIVCLVTIIFATLSTNPKINNIKFSCDAIKKKRINLLFFGNFYHLNLSDFERSIKEIMLDKNYLYEAMINDLHSLGTVLAKKYKYLRYGYLSFMYGMIASVIVFSMAMIWAKYAK